MNEMICNAAKMLFEISDSIILEKLKNRYNEISLQEKERKAMKGKLKISGSSE